MKKKDAVEQDIEKVSYSVSGGQVSVSLDDIVVAMPKPIYQKLMYYIMATTDEISGLGMCRKEGSRITIYELIMPKQENTGASTEIDEEDLSKIITDMVRANRDMSELRLWYHSHSNMKCFWSGTDEATCRKIGQGDWFLSIVANRKKQLLARLDIYKPFHIILDQIEVVVEDDITFEIPQEIKDEVEQKVSCKNYGRNQFGCGGYQRNWGENDWWNKKKKKDDTFQKGPRTFRWNKTLRQLEVFDEDKKEWVAEVEMARKDYQAELDLIVKECETPAPAKWDGEKVVMNSGDTFKPCNDGRKFGDVPPEEVFEYCKGSERNVPLCGSCSYKKECDLFFIGVAQ